MEQHNERSEEEVSQQALALKQQGHSVRQIATALNISPSKAHRLLAKTTEEAETPLAVLDLDRLETLAARALSGNDTEDIREVLAQVVAHQQALTAKLTEAQQQEATAQQSLERATSAALQSRDAIARAHGEEANATAKAAVIEAALIVATYQRKLGPVQSLAQRLRSTVHTLEQQRPGGSTTTRVDICP